MSLPEDRLAPLRVGDLLVLLAALRCGSVTAAARELAVTPSQVSKAIVRVEKIFGTRLVARSGRGVVATERGDELRPWLEEVVARFRATTSGTKTTRDLSVAAPSYLAQTFATAIANALPGARLRVLEMHPSAIRAGAADARFDVALVLGRGGFPGTWTTDVVGSIRSGLLGSPATAKALGRPPIDPQRVRGVPFIAPTVAGAGATLLADDGCPLPILERNLGHRVETFAMGLELAVETGQLVFGPLLPARKYLERRDLVELPVRGWSREDPMLLACHGDRVGASQRRAMVAGLEAICAGGEEAQPPAAVSNG
jgi:DNA-binding transcriptional LysR family regulator